MQNIDVEYVTNALLVMATGSRVMLEVFDSLCRAAAVTVQDFDGL